MNRHYLNLMETFIVESMQPKVNAAGGVGTGRWLARAFDLGDLAIYLIGLNIQVLEVGPHLDERAKELGIWDGGVVQI